MTFTYSDKVEATETPNNELISFKSLEELCQGTEFTVSHHGNGVKVSYPEDYQTFRHLSDAWDYLAEMLVDAVVKVPYFEKIERACCEAYFLKNKSIKEMRKGLNLIRERFNISTPKLTSSTKVLTQYISTLANLNQIGIKIEDEKAEEMQSEPTSTTATPAFSTLIESSKVESSKVESPYFAHESLGFQNAYGSWLTANNDTIKSFSGSQKKNCFINILKAARKNYEDCQITIDIEYCSNLFQGEPMYCDYLK